MRWGILLVAVAALTSCSPSMETRVTRFNQFGGSPAGRTITIQPVEGQRESAEFMTYAHQLARHLQAQGFRPVAGPADYRAILTYGANAPRQVVGSRPVYGQQGGGTTQHRGTIVGPGGMASYSGTSYQAPTYGVVGRQTYAHTIQEQTVTVRIVDARGAPAYEGRVIGPVEAQGIPSPVACMIAALFRDFYSAGSTEVLVRAENC